MKSEILKVISFFLVWRVLLLVVAVLAWQLPTYKDFFPQTFHLLTTWANWDGAHYLNIAQNGYTQNLQYVFFPLFPLVIKVFSFLTLGNFFLSGFLVTNLSLVGFLWLFVKIMKANFSEVLLNKTLILLLLFPTSFFLGAVYTESFFLFLSSLVIYFLLTKKGGDRRFLIAAVIASLAAVTRFVGIFLSLVIFIEYLNHHPKNLATIVKAISLSLISLVGIILYSVYLFEKTGNFLIFITSQTNWGRSELVNPIFLTVNEFGNFFQPGGTGEFINHGIDYFAGLGFIFLSLLLIRKFSLSLGIYSLLVVLLPLFTNTFSSESRFVLVAFPCFMALSYLLKNRILFFLVAGEFGLLLIFLTSHFLRGGWFA